VTIVTKIVEWIIIWFQHVIILVPSHTHHHIIFFTSRITDTTTLLTHSQTTNNTYWLICVFHLHGDTVVVIICHVTSHTNTYYFMIFFILSISVDTTPHTHPKQTNNTPEAYICHSTVIYHHGSKVTSCCILWFMVTFGCQSSPTRYTTFLYYTSNQIVSVTYVVWLNVKLTDVVVVIGDSTHNIVKHLFLVILCTNKNAISPTRDWWHATYIFQTITILSFINGMWFVLSHCGYRKINVCNFRHFYCNLHIFTNRRNFINVHS